jgi:type III pantothenate kinase
MLLAIDCGNTQTVFGLFDGEELLEQFRVATDRAHTGDELAVLLRAFLDLSTLDGIVLCSSVPQLVREYQAFAERWTGAELLVLGPGVSTGMPIRYDDPREVGPDRIANAVAARDRHGAPAIVVDFGTSTNFDVVSAAGEFAGGVLAPGIEISMDALFARAARLPKVPFAAPERVISQTTTAALQSGLVYGFAGQVDAIVERIRDELGAPDAPVVATGGLADLIAPHTRTITAVDPELTLHGLRLVWERNKRIDVELRARGDGSDQAGRSGRA